MTTKPASQGRRFGWEALLLVLAIVGVIVASIRPGTLGPAPRATPDRRALVEDKNRDSLMRLGLVRPLRRERTSSPLGAEEAAALRVGCERQAVALAGHYDPETAYAPLTVVDSFGARSSLSDRPDSLVYEGTVTGPDGTVWVWHCAAARGWDSTRPGEIRSDRDLPWVGLDQRFELVRGLADAAAKECVDRAHRRFPEYEIRTQRRARSADTIIVSGEAFPIFNDLVRGYRCTALIRGGGVASVSVEETR